MNATTATLVIALLCLAAPPLAHGDFVAPNLPAGSQYELAFVTRGARDATSPYIADYNSFVTAQAQENLNLPQGIMWNAIASAAGDIHGIGQADANQNAPFNPSIPVYNTAGRLVANATTPLYGRTLISPIDYDQFGNAFATGVWTGSNADGTADKPLGGQSSYGMPNTGYSTATNAQWIHNTYDGQVSPHNYYALSSPITIVPEPSTICTLTSLLVACGLFWFIRRGRPRFG